MSRWTDADAVIPSINTRSYTRRSYFFLDKMAKSQLLKVKVEKTYGTFILQYTNSFRSPQNWNPTVLDPPKLISNPSKNASSIFGIFANSRCRYTWPNLTTHPHQDLYFELIRVSWSNQVWPPLVQQDHVDEYMADFDSFRFCFHFIRIPAFVLSLSLSFWLWKF